MDEETFQDNVLTPSGRRRRKQELFDRELPDAAVPEDDNVTKVADGVVSARINEAYADGWIDAMKYAASVAASPADTAQQFIFHARVALGIWLDGKKKTGTFEQAMEALDDASVKLEKSPPG